MKLFFWQPWLIPLLPLVGALINGLFGKRFSKSVVASIALFFTGASLLFASVHAYTLLHSGADALETSYGTWIRAGSFAADFGIYLDHLSLVMMLVVTGVGFVIHVYSVAYMEHEGGYYRFFSFLNFFMFFMLTLVLANNYLLLFVGWEGVGLASYLLIGFFFQKDSAANAGKKAFITNRIGDFGFLIALFLLIQHFGTLRFATVFNIASSLPAETTAGLLTAIGLLMLVGACGKSAQIPLYVWLPDAMEGPTPVSALIHAATMVTAGVYMVCRSNAIFSRAPLALLAVAIIGALTSFFAASIGIVQTDIKRVLAYSTVSQLGYMFMAAGVAAYSASIFHLMTHAFFKALLFLGAGSVIHGIGGEQDMRSMGGLRKYMPWTFWTMLIATLAISGIPPFAGFFSKDEILWQAFSSPHGSKIFWAIGIITAFMTSFYMFRLIFLTFTGEYRGAQQDAHSAHADHGHVPHESPWLVLAPLVLLAVLSIIGGWVGGNRFEHFLAPVIQKVQTESPRLQVAESAAIPTSEHGEKTGESKALETSLMSISVLVAFSGLGLAWFFYVKRPELPGKIAAASGGLYKLVLNKYWIDEVYSAVIIGPLVALSRAFLWQIVDQKVVDGSINETATAVRGVSHVVRQQQSGLIRSYAGWIAAGAAVIVAYMVWMGTR
ncbi:MAG: NADH-quinone oxidoreductase subunit L [Acidobacteria bacterium]|nr:MAG: NADH-quinone oxidoreductase subunit L [Acidobacteriota bacterium]